MGLGYGKVVDTECVLCWIRDRFRVEVDVNEKSSHGELSIVEKNKRIMICNECGYVVLRLLDSSWGCINYMNRIYTDCFY